MNDILQLRESSDDSPLLEYRGNSLTRNGFFETVSIYQTALPSQLSGSRDFVLLNTADPLLFYPLLFALWQNNNRVVFPNKEILEKRRSFPLHRYILTIHNGQLALGKNPTYRHLAVPDNGEDTVVFSSGSTGTPKGILHHRNHFLANALAVAGTIKKRNYTGITPLAPYLVSAFSHFLVHHLSEACLVFYSHDEAGMPTNLYRKYPQAAFVGSPMHFFMLTDQLGQEINPSFFFSSGDFISPTLIKRLVERHLPAPFFKVYGLAELAGRFFIKTIDSHTPLNAYEDIGDSIEGASVLVQDDQLFVNAPFLFSGYIHDESFIPARHPHPTGDTVRRSNGIMRLAGRKSDEFKVAGNKVSLAQLESKIAAALPDTEVAMIARPNPHFGHTLALVLCTAKNWRRAELLPLLRGHLDQQELPHEMYYIDAIPRTESMKKDRNRIAAMLGSLRRVSN